MSVRVRFAPSPTGHLHIGSARTAVFNWLYARHAKGKFLLRIEDTDKERSKKEFTEAILEGLKWLGIDWDEEPIYQSSRLAVYKETAEKLVAEGKAYYCSCTPEELEEMREQALKTKAKPKYDGRCREKKEHPKGRPLVIRFKSNSDGITVVEDIIQGRVVFDNSELDDLIILRSDGTPTYNFSAVIDDHYMGITHIIRGNDHLNNTPRQIQIYQALGYPIPVFAHHPLILGEDRAKLSKRHGATGLIEFREQGYLPEALINFLVRIGWSYGDKEVFSIPELIELFEIKDLNRSPGVWNQEKLLWLNGYYLRNKSLEELSGLVLPYFLKKGYPAKKDDYKSLVKSIKGIVGSTFYKACSIAVKDIYGVSIEPPTEEALAEASKLVNEAYKEKGWVSKVFRKSLIDKALWDPYWDICGESFDPELFRRVLRINPLLFGFSSEAKDHNGNSPYVFERQLNLKVGTFEDYMDLVDKTLEEAKRRGDIALKSALAYDRPLLFDEVEKSKAKRVFDKKGVGVTPKESKLFGDYVFHHVLEKAVKLNFPVQFHTGLALIEGSSPMNVVNLIRKYSGVNFMLFHGGYPWIRETAAIALSFPNVYLDLCWLPAISPSACRLLLREVIELGLSSRVTWGGDCWAPEGTYGALKVFKSLLSEVLQEMANKKYLRTDEALEIAFRILNGNAARIFSL